MKAYWYNKTWILTFLLVPFFKPIGPCYYGVFNNIFQLWKAVAVALILGLLLFSNDKKISFSSLKRVYSGLFLFWFIYIINSLRYGTNAADLINNAITSTVLIYFISFYAKHDPVKLLKVLSNIFIVYCLAQFISVIIIRIFGITIFEPIAGDFIYFLGTDNYSAFSLLPMLGVILFSSMINKRKIGVVEWICFISICIENIATWSVTAMLAIIFAVVLMILCRYQAKILDFFSPRNFLVFLNLVLILIVVFHIQNLMSPFFVKVLHKDITLNSRTYIWDGALKLIKEKFVFGWGNLSSKQISSYVLYGTTHAHNMLLELLLRTGIIGCIGYLAFLTGSLQKEWKKYADTSAYVLEIFFLAQLLLFFSDFYVTIMYFYCFMAVTYNLKYFLNIDNSISYNNTLSNGDGNVMKEIGVVILNYMNYEETITCVDSILIQEQVNYYVVIVDNGSKNGSLEKLNQRYSDNAYITILESETNLGYAKGNNIGIQYLRSKNISYILVANSDIVLTSPHILKQMLDSDEKNVGILIPQVRNLDGTIDQRVAYKIRFLYLRIIKKLLQVIYIKSQPRVNPVIEARGKEIVENNKKLTGIQHSYYVITGSAFILTPDFFSIYDQLFPETFLYFEEWATILYLKKAQLFCKIVDNDPILHKGAASTPGNLKNGSLKKYEMSAESAKKILKLVFRTRKYICSHYSNKLKGKKSDATR
jgi:GT2 family glycosyltransferase/O-antigen ligase